MTPTAKTEYVKKLLKDAKKDPKNEAEVSTTLAKILDLHNEYLKTAESVVRKITNQPSDHVPVGTIAKLPPRSIVSALKPKYEAAGSEWAKLNDNQMRQAGIALGMDQSWGDADYIYRYIYRPAVPIVVELDRAAKEDGKPVDETPTAVGQLNRSQLIGLPAKEIYSKLKVYEDWENFNRIPDNKQKEVLEKFGTAKDYNEARRLLTDTLNDYYKGVKIKRPRQISCK